MEMIIVKELMERERSKESPNFASSFYNLVLWWRDKIARHCRQSKRVLVLPMTQSVTLALTGLHNLSVAKEWSEKNNSWEFMKKHGTNAHTLNLTKVKKSKPATTLL